MTHDYWDDGIAPTMVTVVAVLREGTMPPVVVGGDWWQHITVDTGLGGLTLVLDAFTARDLARQLLSEAGPAPALPAVVDAPFTGRDPLTGLGGAA